MGDSSATDDATSLSWAQQWIEQQRALLEQAAQADAAHAGSKQAGSEQVNGLGSQWVDLGKAYLAGLMQMAQGLGAGPAAGGAGPRPPEEMLEAWKAAWSNAMSQATAPGGWQELLNRTPPLGLFREQTEAWRAVAAARADMERLEQELAAVMRRVQSEALVLLEERVKARAGGDNPVQGFRELYDLWVQCSEQVFSTVAHSAAYAHLQGELGNASMRLRARMQKVIEQGLKQFDLPTRSELNSVHQQLRLLKQKVAALDQKGAAAGHGPAESRPPPVSRKQASTSRPASAGTKRKSSAAARPARKRSR